MAKATPIKGPKKAADAAYTVIRDSREKLGWTFEQSQGCAGTVIKALKTGDYTLKGLEKIFVVERKLSVSEVAKNILEKRFEAELIRMDKIPLSFIIFEFTVDDIMKWPLGSGIPRAQQMNMKITNYFILRRLMEIQVQHNAKFIFAGQYAKEVTASLFKRVYEDHLKNSKSSVAAKQGKI
jgi:hypothetical protein